MGKKKIFIIYPPSGKITREERCQQHFKDYLRLMNLPPNDLMYLAAISEKVGYMAKIKDYGLNNQLVDDFIIDLKEFMPDYILFDVCLPSTDNDLSLCQIIKQFSPSTKIIAKGFSFSYAAKNLMEKYPDLDYAIKGEPELTLEELLSDKNLDNIDGLIWRNSTGIIENNNRNLLEDLDYLPFPARHLIDNTKYKRPDNNKPLAVIKVEKGCPYSCFFCLIDSISGKKIRYRDTDNIIKEIKECVEKYRIYNFIFWADLFVFDKEWVKNLCDKIIEAKLNISWSATTRINTLDYELAKLMKKSGCKYICMGIESGNQDILDKMNKQINLDQVKEVHKMLKKTGLKTLTHYIIGLPWETEETINETIKFSIELNSDFASFNIATPFPETKFYDYAVKEGLLEDSDKSYNEMYADSYYLPAIKTEHLDKDKILKLYKKAIKSFYLRPSHLIKTLLSFSSIPAVYSYLKLTFNLMKEN